MDNLFHWPTRALQQAQRALDGLVGLPPFARALFDDDLEFAEVTLERQLPFLDPATGLASLDRPVQRGDEVIPVDRLLDEIAGPAAQCANDQVVLAVSGDHHGRRVGPVRPDLGQQRQTVHPRHPDVGDDRVVVPRGDPVQRQPRGVGRVHGHPVHPQSQGVGQGL